MKKYLLLIALSCAGLFVQAQDIINYFSCDFGSGIPSTFTLHDIDQQTPTAEMRAIGLGVNLPWAFAYMDATMENGFAASSSLYNPAGTANDWMATPSIRIYGSGATLRWKGITCDKSSKLESYSVYISATGPRVEDFTEEPVFSTKGEPSESWNQHSITIDEKYRGKNIYIAFVNNGTDQYVLGIDDITVDGPSPDAYFKVNTGNYVYNTTEVVVSGVFSANSDTPISEYKAYISFNGNTYTKVYSGLNLAKGETHSFSFDEKIPIELSQSINYKVWIEVNNQAFEILEKTTTCLSFEPFRKVVIEEGTGTWCGFCPMGHIAMAQIKEKYPNSFIGIAVHNNDPMTVTAYDKGIAFKAFPQGAINRKYLAAPMVFSQTEGKYTMLEGGFESFLLKAKEEGTIAEILLKGELIKDQRTIKASVDTKFAMDIQKANFKLAFVIIENGVTGYSQVNYFAGSGIEMGGFENLPSTVNPSVMVFNEVARSIDTFKGISGSIPASITHDENMHYDYSISIPSTVKNLDNIEVIVLLLNSTTGEIINANSIDAKKLSSVEPSTTNAFTTHVYPVDNECLVKVQVENSSNIDVELLSVDGRLLDNASAYVDNSYTFTFQTNGAKGVYLVKITAGKNTIVKKIVL